MSEDTAPASDTGEQTAKDAQQAQAQNERTQGNEGQKTAQQAQPGNVPYARFQEVVEQRKGLESTLNDLISGMVSELPEGMRDLVPNLPPAEKAVWIRTAKERGLFSRPGAAPASSPDPKRPSGKPTQDLSGLSPLAKLQRAYGNK